MSDREDMQDGTNGKLNTVENISAFKDMAVDIVPK